MPPARVSVVVADDHPLFRATGLGGLRILNAPARDGAPRHVPIGSTGEERPILTAREREARPDGRRLPGRPSRPARP